MGVLFGVSILGIINGIMFLSSRYAGDKNDSTYEIWAQAFGAASSIFLEIYGPFAWSFVGAAIAVAQVVVLVLTIISHLKPIDTTRYFTPDGDHICRRCKKVFSQGSRYCPHCGQRLI